MSAAVEITPPIGRILDASQQQCGFSPGDTDETTCKKPATWHICWDTTIENGLACEEHMTYAQQFAYLDRHEVGAVCSMPGSTWDFERYLCFVEGSSAPEPAAAALPVPVEAS